MTLGEFLKDRWATIVLTIIGLIIAGFSLHAVRTPTSVVWTICIFLGLVQITALGIEYLRRTNFYKQLRTATRRLDQPSLMMEIIKPPLFVEGAIAHEALSQAMRSMNEEINKYRRSTSDYRTYVETWIHEVKTPIASARLIEKNYPTPEVARMARELTRVERFTEQALYYARATALEHDYSISSTNLGSIVREAVRRNAQLLVDAQVSPKIDKSVDIEVLTDKKWVVFILGQLIANSTTYLRPGIPPQISFTARQSEKDQTRTTYLDITDNGLGIDAADLPRVFEKGFTGKNGRLPSGSASTGIGLYLCKQLAEAMGHQITVDSTKGEGTTVTLVFSSQTTWPDES